MVSANIKFRWRFYKRHGMLQNADFAKYFSEKCHFGPIIAVFKNATSYRYIVTFPDEEVAEESLTSLISSEIVRHPVPIAAIITNPKNSFTHE